MRRKNILVIGSANMDLVITASRFPRPGETILGKRFGMFPGGKGANQAVCCAKLGSNVRFIGKIGNDVLGQKLIRSMKHDGLDLQNVVVDRKAATGIALIIVSADGQNEIVVFSGSNMEFSPTDVERCKSIFSDSVLTLLQLEIRLETVMRAARLARKNNHIVILNPAPARKLPVSLLKLVDIITPNLTEAEVLTNTAITNLAAAEKAGKQLLSSGVKNVVITLAERGCLLVTSKEARLYRAKRVKAIDTTAAGDAFNGAIAYSLAHETSIHKAVQFANNVAAFSVTKMGAQSSMPAMRELRKFL